jgi:ferrous iron transport protein A
MIRSLTNIPEAEAPEAPVSPVAREVTRFTLEGLARIRTGIVAQIEGVEGAPALRRRLLEAGFTPGSPVRFVMATPFGDPLVFSLRGASIALRKSEARCVRVRF